MAKKIGSSSRVTECACVIHGSGYDWQYVERLHSMLNRQLPGGARMHVYTEHDRSVPPHMVKHILEDWAGVSGPKKSWWYKMQLFNSEHWQGPLLYLDLDVVVFNDMTWATAGHHDYFWTLRDFRYLQRTGYSGMNSSLMYWNTVQFDWVWQKFRGENLEDVMRRHAGDQDYIGAVIDHTKRRFYPEKHVQSYRWQVQDGGMQFPSRTFSKPGAGAVIDPEASVIVFHGTPKPHQVSDPLIKQLWK
jgi:hypothetical protein